MSWPTIVIVCIIFPIIANPINNGIQKKLNGKKVLTYLAQLAVNFVVLAALYGIAYLLGFKAFG